MNTIMKDRGRYVLLGAVVLVVLAVFCFRFVRVDRMKQKMEVSATTRQVEWDNTLWQEEKKAPSTFTSYVTFQCPYNKPEIAVEARSAFVVEGKDGSTQMVVEKNFTICPDGTK